MFKFKNVELEIDDLFSTTIIKVYGEKRVKDPVITLKSNSRADLQRSLLYARMMFFIKSFNSIMKGKIRHARRNEYYDALNKIQKQIRKKRDDLVLLSVSNIFVYPFGPHGFDEIEINFKNLYGYEEGSTENIVALIEIRTETRKEKFTVECGFDKKHNSLILLIADRLDYDLNLLELEKEQEAYREGKRLK